jgi:tetratricopeptide (TPR) repeat protein
MGKHSKKRKSSRSEPKDPAAAPPSPPAELLALERPAPFARKQLIDIGIIFTVALALRVVYFLLNRSNNPLFLYPIMDSLYHHEWAEKIAGGDFWGNEVFFRAPLYPYFLALLYKLGGSSIAFAVFCQHLLGSITAVFLYFLAREFFSRRVGLLAGLLYAAYWPLLYFEGELLIVSLILFLNTGFLWVLARAMKSGRQRLFFAAGLILGLSAIARPSVLIFIVVLPLVLRYGSGLLSRRGPRSSWQLNFVWGLAGTVLVILPVTIRNAVIGRDFVPIASQGGVNFYIGNNPQSDGRTAIVPGTRPDWWGGYYDSISRAEKDEGRKLKPSEVSNYYFKKGLEFIFSSPVDAIKLFGLKFYKFWAAGERSNNKYIYFFWDLSGMRRVPLPGFWLIAPLALLGGALQWRRRTSLAGLYLFVISYMAGVVLFFVNARFRLPVVPLLIIFAAYTVFYFYESRRLNKRRLIKAAAALLLLSLALDIDLYTFGENRTRQDSISHYSLGNAYLKMDMRAQALSEYEKARQINQRHPRSSYSLIERNINYDLGLLYWERGFHSRAIEVLEKVGGRDQYTLIAWDRLADSYLRTGRSNEAVELYNRILAVEPGNQSARIGLARAYRATGDLARAKDLLVRELTPAESANPEIHFELAATLERLGEIEPAIQSYLIAAEDPSYQKESCLRLAALYQQAGQYERAAEYLRKAQAARSVNPKLESSLKLLNGTP